jgi:predicted nucleotidyltransferase
MNPHDPNLAKVELIADALGTLCDELVFVGGCAAGLLLSDPAATVARITFDVDLVVEVTALRGYHTMESAFAERGFKRDMSPDAPICGWRFREIEVDLMPTDEDILGFANHWYPTAVTTASRVDLPGGRAIRLISAPCFLATKFEAFADRGNADVLGSHDLEDIINVIDGRPELLDEIAGTSLELRAYLADRCAALLATPHFENYLPGLLAQDETLAQRVTTTLARLQSIAANSSP